MAKVDIFMPFYVGDYLKDTNRLSAAEHGAYLMLMLDYWQNGPIPDDERILFRLSRMSASEWVESREVILAYFKRKDGKLFHSRIDRELQAAIERKEHFSERGKAGAAAKWKDHQNASSNATSIKQAPKTDACAVLSPMPKKWPSPSPSPSHTTSESKSLSLSPDVALVLECRPEFSKLNPVDVAREIQIGRESGDQFKFKFKFDSFLADAANSIPCPKNPIGMLRAYLNRESKTKTTGRRGTL